MIVGLLMLLGVLALAATVVVVATLIQNRRIEDEPVSALERTPLGGGMELVHHSDGMCKGECPLHRPSDHSMVGWRINWRPDRGIIERLCPEHGVGHPDPDSLAWVNRNGEVDPGDHGCCGCCSKGVGA